MRSEDNQAQNTNAKTIFYKKWWFWVIIVIVVIAFISVGTSQEGSNSQVNETASVRVEANEEEASTASENVNPESFRGVEFTRSDVRNDVTGKWKISSVAEMSLDPEEYALDYYNLYMKDSDTGVEGIVNFSNGTTTAINEVGGVVDVTVHEYVDGEEHDAKRLFSGAVLKEFQVNPHTGEIEVIR